MEPSLAWNNFLAYSLQVGLLVGLLAFVPALVRLRAPRARLLYWHLLLAACLLLPLVRPWRPQVVAGNVEVSTVITRTAPAAPAHRPIPWNGAALALLAAGALGRLVWLGVGMRRLRRYRRNAVPLDGIAFLSSEIQSPVTFGFRRPVILLPAHFPDLPPAIQHAILCHENLHVERRDWLFTIAEELVRALFWFHPAIWWLLGEIQLAREQAVDQSVVAVTGARDPYVDALLAIAGAGSHLDLAPAPLFLRRRHLKHRVIGILKERNMSQKILVPALAASLALMAAACWFVTGAVPLLAAPQLVADAPGVSVNMNGAPLMHRAPVAYPPSAIASGIQGTVTVQVKLDANGEVSDAAVLSGPDELRKPVIQSVLSWHFSKEVAGSTRTINIDFTLPAAPAAAQAQPANRFEAYARIAAPPFPGTDSAVRTINSIEMPGLSDQAREELLARLAVHVGDTLESSKVPEIAASVKTFDSHLVLMMVPASSGGVTLRIAPSAVPATAVAPMTPSKIRVGGNVQAAMLIEQQRPVYPPDAKAAGIQGKVQLQATIGPDGHVQDLVVLSGEPSLAAAAMEAVKNWVYKTTLLNGNPVSVVTVIDVNFTLAQ
jgi:TonB family protein